MIPYAKRRAYFRHYYRRNAPLFRARAKARYRALKAKVLHG